MIPEGLTLWNFAISGTESAILEDSATEFHHFCPFLILDSVSGAKTPILVPTRRDYTISGTKLPVLEPARLNFIISGAKHPFLSQVAGKTSFLEQNTHF